MSLVATAVIEDEISGKPRTIVNPLQADHVRIGLTLWYEGYTSVGRWNCPAIITQVDDAKRRFRVRSLDDMVEHHQWYAFDASDDNSSSRQTMRIVEQSTIDDYLVRQRKALAENVERAERAMQSARAALTHFDKIRSTLTF